MATDSGLQAVLSPEARVVLLTAGGADVDVQLRHALARPINWARVAWLSEWEHASAVVWRRLSRTARDLIPGEIATAWEPLAMVAEFQAAHLRDRFLETLQEFERVGIPVILLKGAGLAHCAYADYRERPMGDIDLLVAPARAQEAWAIAQQGGWFWNPELFPAAKYEGHHHLPPLLDARKTGMKLELHTALSVFGHPFSFGFDALEKVTRTVVVAGLPARVLNENYQIVHLCVHFAWSHMMALGARRTFRDLRALIDTGRVSWDAVIVLARQHGAASSCYWTLDLASRLVGLGVPPEVLREMHVPLLPGLRGVVERHLATQLFATERVCPSEAVRRALWAAAMRPRRLKLGEGRPWDLDEVVPRPSAEPKASWMRRLLRHSEQVMQWSHYVRAVAVPR